MSIVCEGLADVLNYFDDVVVYGSTPKEHRKNLRALMERLLASGLCLNAEKCIIGVPELNFLGYIISAACIRPNPKKVKATSDAPKPQE